MLKLPNIRINVDTPNRDLFLKDGLKNPPICEILGKGSYGTVIKAVYKGKFFGAFFGLLINPLADFISTRKLHVVIKSTRS